MNVGLLVAGLLSVVASIQRVHSGGLQDAVKHGDLHRVKLLIAQHADLEERLDRFTPLAVAIEERDYAIASVLASAGAKVNPTGGSISCLDLAMPDKRFMRLVLRNGATKPSKPKDLLTIYRQVGPKSFEAVVRLLQEYGMDVNMTDDFGTTPLMLAGTIKDLTYAKVFIGLGAKLDAQDCYGQTALFRSTWVVNRVPLGRSDDPQLTGDYSPVPEGDIRDISLFVPDPGLAKLLIDSGANLSVKDFQGRTALDIAISNGNTPVEKLLLARRRHEGKEISHRGITLAW